MADVSPPLAPGPYHNTETKTYRLTGPIELVVTVKRESSHVPPDRPPASPMPPSPFAARERDEMLAKAIIDGLKPLAVEILTRLHAIHQALENDADADPAPDER